MLGLAAAAVREFSDRSLHNADEVQQHLGLPLIGYLGDQSRAVQGRRSKSNPSLMARLASDYPDSAFAETIRNAVISLASLDRARPLVVGVISALPGEGSSTVAANLAGMAALLGRRTVLVDSDWRTASLTRRLMPELAQETHAQEAQGGIRLLRPVATAEGLLLAVPQLGRQGRAHPLTDAGLAATIDAVRDHSDLVIADFAALGPYSDALGAAAHVDAFVLVVHWGKTARQDMQGTLRRSPQIFEKCLGVIFNRTDRSRLAKYQGAWSGETASAGLFLADPVGVPA